jgi:hypothetical protein
LSDTGSNFCVKLDGGVSGGSAETAEEKAVTSHETVAISDGCPAFRDNNCLRRP